MSPSKPHSIKSQRLSRTLQGTVRSLGADHDEAEPLVKRLVRAEAELRRARERLRKLSDGAEADEHAAGVALDALKK